MWIMTPGSPCNSLFVFPSLRGIARLGLQLQKKTVLDFWSWLMTLGCVRHVLAIFTFIFNRQNVAFFLGGGGFQVVCTLAVPSCSSKPLLSRRTLFAWLAALTGYLAFLFTMPVTGAVHSGAARYRSWFRAPTRSAAELSRSMIARTFYAKMSLKGL